MDCVVGTVAGEHYKLEITKVNNGYMVRENNRNMPSFVFLSQDELILFIKQFFVEGKKHV